MIAFVEGVVEEVRTGSLVIRAGAWGVEALTPASTTAQARVGQPVRLHTHLVVREDAWTLYGFGDEVGLRLFRLLLGVSGVGPKLALAVLSNLPLQVIASAVVNDDPALLAAAPGVGKRTAERIVLDLKSRMPDDLLLPAEGDQPAPRSGFGAEAQDAVDALIALGYREAAVKATVSELAADQPDAAAETLIRKALAKMR